jgi:ribosomal protein L29
MQYKDLAGKSLKELQGLLTEDRTRLHALRLKRSVNQIKDVREIRELRQRIARLLTRIKLLSQVSTST